MYWLHKPNGCRDPVWSFPVHIPLVAICVLGVCGHDAPLSEETAARVYAGEVCELLRACDCLTPAEVDECKSRRAHELDWAYIRARKASLIFDGTCARRHLKQITSIGCASDLPDTKADCSTSCFEYHGAVGAGEACSAVDGTPFSNCRQGLKCASGVCGSACVRTEDSLKAGEPCRDGHLVLGTCSEGLICDAGGSDRCMDAPSEGQACISGQCGDGLWCQTIITESTCRPKVDAGEACTRQEACLSGVCSNGVCSEGKTVAGRPKIGDSCDGPCHEALCDSGRCVAIPPSPRRAAVCSLGVDGHLLKDADPAGACETPQLLPSSSDLWIAFPKYGHANTIDGSCARNNEPDMVFSYAAPGSGMLLLTLTHMRLSRGALFVRTECTPLTHDGETLACNSKGDHKGVYEEEFLSAKMDGTQRVKVVVSDPNAVISADAVLRLRHVPLPASVQTNVQADTCVTVRPLTLTPSGNFMVAHVRGSFANAQDSGICGDGPHLFFAVTVERDSLVHVAVVPTGAEQRMSLFGMYDCEPLHVWCTRGPIGGQASGRYSLRASERLIFVVGSDGSDGEDFELLLAAEPK